MIDKLRSNIRALKDQTVSALLSLDKSGQLRTDPWQHQAKGGGETSLLIGEVFERGAVAFSHVEATLDAEMCAQMVNRREELPFEAFGTSLVIHPYSPLVPTVHANFRYLRVGEISWVGGGTDLTPYVLDEGDAMHFHTTLKGVCDRFDLAYYSRFKKWCDEYFFLPHRGEARGLGGIFFDYLGRENGDAQSYFDFVAALAKAFGEAYFPIVERHMYREFTTHQKEFQLIRRGRYVEFNLLYDRGTLFGLRSGGRVESILMSLPPSVNWVYNRSAQSGSEEELLVAVLRSPRDWISAENIGH